MASKNLGTLTIDLVAKTGGFVQGMDKAERSAKKSSKGIKGAAEDAAKSWRVAAGAAAGAFAGFAIGATINAVIKNTRQLEQEQAQLAAVLTSTGEAAGFSRDQLNEMAQGLANVSTLSTNEINQAQTALLAFTGVVGDDFVRAQQAAADMAARTGMSIQQTAETIGRALDVPSKGMAALSRQGFRFSDDQKEIIKHLEDTGRAAEAQGIILQALEESYGGAAIAARDTFGGAIQALQNTIGGLLTGKEGSLDSAKGAIEDLNTALSDPATAAAVALVVDNITAGAAAVVSAIPFMIDAADGVTRVFSIAADGLIGVYSKAAMHVQNLAASVLEAMSILPDSLSGSGFAARAAEYRQAAAENLSIAQQAADGIRDSLERPLAGTAMAGAARQAAALNEVKKEGIALDEDAELAAARAAEASRKAALEAEKAAKKAADEAKRRAAAIESELTALERAAKVWGMSADEVKIYDLRIQGASESQLEYAQSLLETVSALEAQKDLQEEYAEVVKSLRTDEEARLDTLREQLAVLDQMGDTENRGRAIGGAFEGAPEFQGAGDLGGFMGEFSKYDDAEKELDEWHAKQIEMLRELRDQQLLTNEEFNQKELELKQQHENSMAEIERARFQTGLEATQQFLGQLAELRNSDNKKGRQIAKTAAIAQATINAYTAATGAYASASAIPVVGWVLGPVAAAAALAAGLANVSAIKGQAHDGIMSVPNSGTWNLEKGERVLPQDTAARLDATLANIERGNGSRRGSGGAVINQTINTNGRIDKRTANQIAIDTSRQQRIASARLGT